MRKCKECKELFKPARKERQFCSKNCASKYRWKSSKFKSATSSSISKSLRGRIRSKDERVSISKGLTGRKLSPQTKKKISATHLSKRKTNLPIHTKHQIRRCNEYNIWRRLVLERDSYTCVLCEANTKVEVDHFPKQFATIIDENCIRTLQHAIDCEELWDIDNGRTLCVPCHRSETYGFERTL